MLRSFVPVLVLWGVCFTAVSSAGWDARTTLTNTAVTSVDVQQALNAGLTPAFIQTFPVSNFGIHVPVDRHQVKDLAQDLVYVGLGSLPATRTAIIVWRKATSPMWFCYPRESATTSKSNGWASACKPWPVISPGSWFNTNPGQPACLPLPLLRIGPIGPITNGAPSRIVERRPARWR